MSSQPVQVMMIASKHSAQLPVQAEVTPCTQASQCTDGQLQHWRSLHVLLMTLRTRGTPVGARRWSPLTILLVNVSSGSPYASARRVDTVSAVRSRLFPQLFITSSQTGKLAGTTCCGAAADDAWLLSLQKYLHLTSAPVGSCAAFPGVYDSMRHCIGSYAIIANQCTCPILLMMQCDSPGF